MSERPWMPLNVDDYMADTLHLSAAEHGAYMLLIMRYWKDGGLPDDERMIQRYSRLTPEQWAESRDVLATFFLDGWKHKRLDAELTKASEIIGKRRAAAERMHSKRTASAEQEHGTSSDTRVPHRTNNSPSSLRSDGEARKRAERLPEDWTLPDEWRADAVDAGLPSQAIDLEAAKMRDWSRSAPKGLKRDWRAAWRNWCRDAASRLPRGSPPQRSNPLSDAFGMMRGHDDRPTEPVSDSVRYLPAASR